MNLMALLSLTKVCNMVALFVRLINDIASIIAQRNRNNNASDEDILKVLPHNLYALQTSL